MKRALIEAMARENIDRDAAVRVILALFPDASIDPAQFPPEVHGGYVLRAERLEDILPEVHPLHAEHYAETEKYRAGIPMDPDYGAMLEREQAGRVLQITARRDGVLVGHIRMYLNSSLHTQTLFAEEDTLYLTPAHRGGMTSIRMIQYVEKCLKTLGVLEVRSNTKIANRADILMRRLGYQPVAIQFCKALSDEKSRPIVSEPAGRVRPDNWRVRLEAAIRPGLR